MAALAPRTQKKSRNFYHRPDTGVTIAFHEREAGSRLAYRQRRRPWPDHHLLSRIRVRHGRSQGRGSRCIRGAGRPSFLRFDYAGTGSSDGRFEEGTLASWLEDAAFIVDRLTDGPVVLVGSSMGGWISLHLALRIPQRVAAIVGIAAAPDFTDWGFPDHLKGRLGAGETLRREFPDGGAQVTTTGFWQSGQSMRLLDSEIAIDCPVRLIHGDVDDAVPLGIAFRPQGRSAFSRCAGDGHQGRRPSAFGGA